MLEPRCVRCDLSVWQAEGSIELTGFGVYTKPEGKSDESLTDALEPSDLPDTVTGSQSKYQRFDLRHGHHAGAPEVSE